jgi:hypothetical protein
MTRLIYFFSLTLLSTNLFGQTKFFKEKKIIDFACDNFMKSFKEGKFSEALDTLKKYSVIDSSKIDALLITVKQQMTKTIDSYGNVLSFDFIKEKTIKDFFVKRFYVLKFDDFFLKFYFNLYNNGSGWTITYFGYTEEFDDLF